MYIFIFSILRYLFSGLRNGAYYTNNKLSLLFNVLTILCFLGTSYLCLYNSWEFLSSSWLTLVSAGKIIAIILGVTTSILVLVHSKNKYLNDFHLKVALESVFYSGLCFISGFDTLLACLCAVYPGVILQKISINLYSGLKWNSERTDDESGKTYGLPSLGIKIPRLTFNTRIAFAILSVLFYLIKLISF